MSEKKDTLIMADSILSMLEDIADIFGLPVDLEIIPTAPEHLPALMQQSLPGDPVVKAYKSGIYIGAYRWVLYLRLDIKDTDGRIGAVEVLTQIAEWIRCYTPELPEGFEFHLTQPDSYPTLRDATEQYETYQVTLITHYKCNRRKE